MLPGDGSWGERTILPNISGGGFRGELSAFFRSGNETGAGGDRDGSFEKSLIFLVGTTYIV